MMRPTRLGGRFCVAAMAAMLFFGAVGQVQSQSDTPPVVSRGENFSARPAPALFNADCTGAGCHKGPQGLGKGQSQSGLAGFLREHYTNSRESAGALAAYILKFPAGASVDPRAARASNPRPGSERSTAEAAEPARPAPTPRNQRGRQQPTAAVAPPPAEPVPPPPPAAPPPPQFDIFD
jgi:hypothetical protein